MKITLQKSRIIIFHFNRFYIDHIQNYHFPVLEKEEKERLFRSLILHCARKDIRNRASCLCVRNISVSRNFPTKAPLLSCSKRYRYRSKDTHTFLYSYKATRRIEPTEFLLYLLSIYRSAPFSFICCQMFHNFISRVSLRYAAYLFSSPRYLSSQVSCILPRECYYY